MTAPPSTDVVRSFDDHILEDSNLPINVVSALSQLARPPVQNAVLAYAQHPPPARASLNRYWDKRRVQTTLRRLLESVEELQGGHAGSDPLAAVLGAFFDAHFRLGGVRSGDASAGSEGVDEAIFRETLVTAGAWPSELTANDRQEIAAAMAVGTAGALRHAQQAGGVPSRVTREKFVQLLSRVPFNLPDFPVPVPVEPFAQTEVARMLVELVSAPGWQYHMLDFTLSGLVSAEELQAQLPRLVPLKQVELAVLHVVDTASQYLTKGEWQTHVWNLLPEEILSRLDQPKEEVCSLSSPAMRHRQVESPRFAGRDGRRQARPKRTLVNWYSCTTEAPEEGVLDITDRVMVLDLHPTDSRGPFLAASLACCAKRYKDKGLSRR